MKYRLIWIVVAVRQHMGLPTVFPTEEFATNITFEMFGGAVSSVVTLKASLTVPKGATDLTLKAFCGLLLRKGKKDYNSVLIYIKLYELLV